jgi:serine/threonine protein kinase
LLNRARLIQWISFIATFGVIRFYTSFIHYYQTRLSYPNIKRLLQIKAGELAFGRLIGEGSFGEVWLGKWRQTPAALKQIKQDQQSILQF